jgi:Fungal specific transcription factor domain
LPLPTQVTLTPTPRLDKNANFKPIKDLSFDCALSTPSGVHFVLSAAAFDLAVKHGKQNSPAAIIHHSKALEIVRKSLVPLNQGQSDDIITAVTLLIGHEV